MFTNFSFENLIYPFNFQFRKLIYQLDVPNEFTNSVKLNTKPRKPYSASVNIPRTKNKSRGILNISPYIKENSLS